MKCVKTGFTLIEILVVILIISIIAGIVGINVYRHPAAARRSATRLQIRTLKDALQLYRMEQGRYPTQEQGLAALCRKPVLPPVPQNYPENGYLDSSEPPLDPWGKPYIYIVPGRNRNEPFEIISYGADGEPGGTGEAADISSSDPGPGT